jgi:cytochrome P450
MGVKSLDDAPFVDILSADGKGGGDDLVAIIDDLRRATGVVRTPVGAMVIRRDLVQGLLADRRLGTSMLQIAAIQGVTDGIVYDLLRNSLLVVEGDDHARIRRLVNRAFTPRAVDRHRPVMQDILGSLLDPVVARGRCELMGEVAEHYPIRVICHLLGVPDEDLGDFTAWARAVAWVLSFALSTHRDEAEWGAMQIDAYVGRLVESRRREPADDMVTELVQAEEAGDRLSDWELRALIGGLLFAGFDTTRNQLGLALAVFCEHPDQWALLGSQPALAARAVDEVMRFAGAVRAVPRVVVEPLSVDGYELPLGTLVTLSTGAANRDPTAFVDPGTFDITVAREPHLTFGGGPHYCLGANLARAEMQEALAAMAARMPGLVLDGEPTWREPMGIFGPETLPLRFG